MESGRFVIKGRTFFLLIYFVTFFTLYLGLIPKFSLGGALQDIKFIYIAYGIFCLFAYNRRFNRRVTLLFLGLLGYVLAFGLIFRNPRVGWGINAHLIMMLIYLSMLFTTYLEVRRFRCFVPFLKVTYLSLSLFLLILCISNWRQLVLNPLYFIKVLVLDLRVRSDFGIQGTSNYLGAFCFVTLIVSVFYFYSLRMSGKKILSDRFSWYMLPVDLVIFLMFGSSSSRSPLASMLVFLVVFTLFCFQDYIRKYWPLVLALGVLGFGALIGMGFFEYVWANSNRAMNVSVNKIAFQQAGNIWTGMGFVDNGLFNAASGYPWGVYTSSLDMNYVYLYYTTGIIGVVWIGSVLVAMLIQILKKHSRKYFPIMFSMYASLLFYAYWETMLFTYRFWPFMMLYCILWLFIDGSVCDDLPAENILGKKRMDGAGRRSRLTY